MCFVLYGLNKPELELPGGGTATRLCSLLRSSGYCMTIYAYFDGSGSESDDLLTLVGMAAPQAVWAELEEGWAKVLWKHNVCESHMFEAHSGKGLFTKERGWDRDRVGVLVSDLEDVLTVFGSTKDTFCTCSQIVVPDHKESKLAMPRVQVNGINRAYPSPSELCAFDCLNHLCWHYPTSTFGMLFDRGEPFFKHVDQIWTNNRKRQNHPHINRVRDLGKSSSESSLALQAADFFAWNVNRFWHRCDQPQGWRLGSIISTTSARWETSSGLMDQTLIASVLSGKWAFNI